MASFSCLEPCLAERLLLVTEKGLSVDQELFLWSRTWFSPSVTLSAHLPGQHAFLAVVCAVGNFHTILMSVDSMLDAGFGSIQLWRTSRKRHMTLYGQVLVMRVNRPALPGDQGCHNCGWHTGVPLGPISQRSPLGTRAKGSLIAFCLNTENIAIKPIPVEGIVQTCPPHLPSLWCSLRSLWEEGQRGGCTGTMK